MPVVEASGLRFAYGSDAPVFSDLSFSASSGELTVLEGYSGSGKSTLLNVLSGVRRAAGTVRILGSGLSSRSSERAALRLQHFGFVFQRGELLPEFTVLENVSLPLRLLGSRRKDAEAASMQALENLGIAGCAQRLPSNVSGGQAQRASLARALVHKPPIIFADEPTSSLDPENRRIVTDSLVQAAALGACVVVATHDEELRRASHHRFDVSREEFIE